MFSRVFPAMLAAFTVLSAAQFTTTPVQKREFRIGSKPVVELVRNGQIGFEIVCGKTPTAKAAAQEMVAVFNKAFNTKLKISQKPSGKLPVIYVGSIEKAKECGIDLAKLDRDGFIIKSCGKDVLIIGRDDPKKNPMRAHFAYGDCGEHATMNGVYEFLERFAGVRFYFAYDEGTIIPKRKNWSLPEICISDRPDYMQRRISMGKCAYPKGYPNARCLNHLRLRLESWVIPNCHGLASLGYVPRFKKTHPEYFALKADGQRHYNEHSAIPSAREGHLCLSSGIKQVVINDADAFLHGKSAKESGILMPNGKYYWSWSKFPPMPFFNIMLNDSSNICHCPECWKHFSKGPQATTDFFWQFFADIANEGKKRNLPGYFTTMAYAEYRMIPNVEIPDNLLVMLALRGPWNEGTPGAIAKEQKLLQAWTKKLKGKTWLWTYPRKGSDELNGIPYYAPIAVGKYFARFAPWIFGAYLEAETDVFMAGALNYYMFSRVAWNNQANPEEIYKEYHTLMFGPAAGTMTKISRTLEQKWHAIINKSVDTPEGPVTVLPNLQELWNYYWSAAEIAKIEKLFNQAEKECAKDVDALKRVRFIRRELWKPLTDTRAAWLKDTDSKANWTAVMPENKWSKPYYLIPLFNKPAEVKTTFQLKRDAQNYYIRFNCEEPDTNAMMIMKKRKADDVKLWEDCGVEVHLVPDGKTHHQFMINANGVLTDIRHAPGFVNTKWNSGAKVSARITAGKGYTVEIAVPRKSMPEAVPGKFTANFTRHRVIEGKSTTPYYEWSFFAKHFCDQQNFGRILFEEPEDRNLFKDGSFSAPVRGRWVGKNWFGVRSLKRDETTFVLDGSSIKVPCGEAIVQYVDMKPDTEYLLSFWMKLEKGAVFYIRFDENTGHVTWLPRTNICGPVAWTYQQFRVKTHRDPVPKKKSFVRFQLKQGTKGALWINRAALIELPKEKK